jgi:hypothetical protein
LEKFKELSAAEGCHLLHLQSAAPCHAASIACRAYPVVLSGCIARSAAALMVCWPGCFVTDRQV